MNLLLLTPGEVTPGRVIELSGRRADHIFCVLHGKPGDMLRAGLLNGNLGNAEILESTRHRAVIRLGELDQPPPAGWDFIPIIALPRPQSFKKTLHFIASSGIRKAIFTGADKVEKSYWKSSAMTPQAIEEELILGLEQGGTTIMPELIFRQSLRHFMMSEEFRTLTENGLKLIAHPRNVAPCPAQVHGKVICAIGPEGGYRDEEVDAFVDAGFQSVEIGAHILRVEFALSCLYGRLVPF